MSTKVNGVNVTNIDYLDIETTIYVGGQELTLSDLGAIDATKPWSNLTELACDRLFVDGAEIVASGAAIPASFRGTRLTNVNVTEELAVNGQTWAQKYTMNQVDTQGTAAFEQTGNLGIASAVSAWSFSCWITFAGVGGRQRFIQFFDSVAPRSNLTITKETDETVDVVQTNDGVTVDNLNAGLLLLDQMQHLFVTFDGATNRLAAWLDGVKIDDITTDLSTLDLDVSDTTFVLNADGNNRIINGCVGDIWFDTTYLDFDQTAVSQLFRSSEGNPVYLGANGESPTGSAPLLFFGSDYTADDWNTGTNLGTGGDFTVISTFIDC